MNRVFLFEDYRNKAIYGEARENNDALYMLLQEYVSSHLAFYLHYYREEAFQGEMELLPDSCKAAVYLNEAFQSEAQGDYRVALLVLKDCLGKCASLDETIQVYSHMYVARLKEQLQ